MKKNILKLLVLCLITALLLPTIVTADTQASTTKPISIFFSHDTHSHLEKYAKVSTLLKEGRMENPATFALDAGDFSMGTPYQTISKDEAGELRMMGAIGYDATTIGNHEFDFRSKGLTAMLTSAFESGDRLPQIVAANFDWEATKEVSELKADAEALETAMKNLNVKDYTVIERGGVKIAVFGLMGDEAASYAPESGTLFKDPIETAQKTVDKINANEEVDLIVCVSHSGTDKDNPEDSEDEIIAEEVDGIDLIVSGHSHTKLPEPKIINDTVVGSCGENHNNLGHVTFSKKGGRYEFDSYELIPLDKKIVADPETAAGIAGFKGLVNDQYFAKFGYKWDTVLAENGVPFIDYEQFGEEQGEDTLGNLIADSYIYGVQQAEGDNYEPVDVAVAPSGVIRGSFEKGNITAADAFNALSIGTGKDGISGYPLVGVYLTGKELKLAAEIDISISPIMSPARLYFSGLAYAYNPHRMILNKTFDVALTDAAGSRVEINDDELYRVVADLYSAQMLSTVNSMSYGLLSVVPKDRDGNPITDFEDFIIYNQDGSELKEWYALASYIDSFEGDQVPAKYSHTEGRKVLEDSRAIGDLLKDTNKFFWIIIGVLALVILIVVLIVVVTVKLVKRYKRRKAENR